MSAKKIVDIKNIVNKRTFVLVNPEGYMMTDIKYPTREMTRIMAVNVLCRGLRKDGETDSQLWYDLEHKGYRVVEIYVSYIVRT